MPRTVRPTDQIRQMAEIIFAEHHCIDLDRKSGRLGCFDSGKSFANVAAPRDTPVALRVEVIERDVDSPHAGCE